MLTIRIDTKEGMTLPDEKVIPFAKQHMAKYLETKKPYEVGIGSRLMLDAFIVELMKSHQAGTLDACKDVNVIINGESASVDKMGFLTKWPDELEISTNLARERMELWANPKKESKC